MKGLLLSTLACTTCFGNPSEGEAAGMQWAIFLLAGLAIVLQIAVAGLLYRVLRRNRANPVDVGALPQEALE